MRAKMRVENVVVQSDGVEELHFTAVGPTGPYPGDGSDENNTFARWTPCADLQMIVQNPALIGKFKAGEEYYLDFTKAG